MAGTIGESGSSSTPSLRTEDAENDESLLRRLVGRVRGSADGGDDEVAYDHTGGADQEHSATASLVSKPKTVREDRASRSAISCLDRLFLPSDFEPKERTPEPWRRR